MKLSRLLALSAGDLLPQEKPSGANYTFVDGHAKWHKFNQTYNPTAKRDWYIPNSAAAKQYNRGYWKP